MCKGELGLVEARLALAQLAALIRHAQEGAAQWERRLGEERLAACAAHLQAAADVLAQVVGSLQPTATEQPGATYTVTPVQGAPQVGRR